MNKKWYFNVLLSALALLMVMQQQTVVPNQEIVLEFLNTEVSNLETQNAIALVKKQLQAVGVKKTRILRGLEKGKLKITYYSDSDVAYIKKILSKEQYLGIDVVFHNNKENKGKSPLEKSPKNYKLNVREIQKTGDFDSDFVVETVLKVTHEQVVYHGSDAFSFSTKIYIDPLHRFTEIAQKVQTKIALAINNTSRKIPEVRAGPIS